MKTVEFEKGDVIFHEGDEGNSLFVVEDGSVGICLKYGEAEEQKIKTLKKDSIFGEMAVIEAYPRSATAVALENTKVTEVESGKLNEYFTSNPDKIIQIMQQLSLRIRELTFDYTEVNKIVADLQKYTGNVKENASLIDKIKKFAQSSKKGKSKEVKSVESLKKLNGSHKEGFILHVESYPKGTIIFKEGEPGDTMYDIHYGQIGIYKNYGTPDEKCLTTLSENKFFGEMAMLDDEKRSATAVVVSETATVEAISKNDLKELFDKNPPKVEMILAHMSSRLRKLTNEYLKACDLFFDIYHSDAWDKAMIDRTEKYRESFYD